MLRYRWLALSIVSVFVSFTMIILTVFADNDGAGEPGIFLLIVASIFWLSAVAECAFLILIYREAPKGKSCKLPGVFRVFTNKYATATDILLAAAVAVTVAASAAGCEGLTFYTILIALIYLALNLHCILNGRVFNKLINNKGEVSDEQV